MSETPVLLTASIWRQVLAQMNHVTSCKCDGCRAIRALVSEATVCIEAERLARMREALQNLCDEVAAMQEHGDGADDAECPVCIAHKAAREALAAQEVGNR